MNGSILVAPCSRIGHVFRRARPYKNVSTKQNTLLYNSVRTVKVWFDEYEVVCVSVQYTY